MCCGQDDGPQGAAVKTEETMAKVYTATPGAVMQIGTYGMASNEYAALVPEDVAAELASRADLVVVREQAPPPPAADFTFPDDGAASADTEPAAPAKRAFRAQKE